MSDIQFGWKAKGQPWPLELIYRHCLIRLNISSENNDFGSNSIKKSTFQKKNPFKCIRKQNRPWSLVGQGQSRIIIWINLLGPTSPMLHTKSQGHLPFGSGEDFLRVYTIYGNGGHLGHVTRTIWTNLGSLSLRSLHMKFDFDWPGGFWKNYVLIYCWDSNISNLGWKVKGKPWPLELSYSHCLIMLNISSENNDIGFNSFQNINFKKISHLNELGSKFDLAVN